MENKTEDEIRKRWEQEAKDKEDQQDTQPRPKKRLRAIEYNNGDDTLGLGYPAGASTRGGKLPAVKPQARKPGRAAGTRAKNRITELADEEDVVELD